jgi:hypothetical protein
MIGAAHTSTLSDLEAARRDLRAAEGFARFEMPDTPILPLLGLSGPYSEAGFMLDWSRDAAGMED